MYDWQTPTDSNELSSYKFWSLFGNALVKLKQSPEGIKSPYKFPIGSTTITYTAEDQEGNKNSCSFTVEVIGKF